MAFPSFKVDGATLVIDDGAGAVFFPDDASIAAWERRARALDLAGELLQHVELLERSIEYEIRKSASDSDDEGARLKAITLAQVRETLAKVRAA